MFVATSDATVHHDRPRLSADAVRRHASVVLRASHP